ncbi:3-phosphoshikimate 1-carboxyvinyltransferase [Daejeonella lutea]|uniref:3-phosphoshikimate 1-carboxyvinyltransferase n=1 Tax=Daejeonella lutea TaxID=572036 RepID=A0A1T5F494_9SPHI|nr:3-phosphoshikimate 1-carboxyvinyltransferase [Daejeonella lutea]SKB91037.1 3-phosphoshikimate 1-carboxyvinyltransferase [Daejeonella lutea]
MSSAAIKISAETKKLSGTIHLTGSKSESNRALIMQAMSKGAVTVTNVSEAADTVTLLGILQPSLPTEASAKEGKVTTESEPRDQSSDLASRISHPIDIGPAGTAMRFLTAYYTLQDGEVTLTGSARMKQRPIGILVDALRELGAEIDYTENDGYPPIRIKGPLKQKSERVSIKGDISSQYISSLLLAAPLLEKGLYLDIEGELTSKPYVEMTLAMLSQAGIRYTWDANTIHIPNQPYANCEISVEPDWSAASYWYAIAALADEAELFLPGLNGYSLQGDSKITEIMANFGITSQFKDGGVFLKKEPKTVERKIFDFKECPDLAQTVVVVCAALGHDATFTGLETLKIKETDRVNALQVELAKIGVKLIEKNMTYKLDCSERDLSKSITVNTYDDHRMAMAFAPLALVLNEMQIEDHRVVEKSYPHFWKDLESIGYNIEVLNSK